MHRHFRPIALAAALALFACQDPAAVDEGARRAQLERGTIGSVTFRYDSALLAPADVQFAIPPGGTRNTFGIKLVPAREVADHEEHLCPEDGSADTHPCTLAEEPGLTFAVLELPYATYASRWRESDLKDAIRTSSIDGVEALSVDAGDEGGLQIRYTLAPVEDRALLIKRQSDGETAAESAALAAVIASLDLPG